MRLALIGFVFMLAACSGLEHSPPPYRHTLDINQLMSLVVEPAADRIWDSSGFIVTYEGEQDLSPTTEQGWLEVKHGAAVVMEAGNLLMMPQRSQGREDWIQISRGLVDAGERAMAAADAEDADALFDSGAAIYSACVSCHQLHWADGGRFVEP